MRLVVSIRDESRNSGVLEIIIFKLFFPVSSLCSDFTSSFQCMSPVPITTICSSQIQAC